MTPARLGGKMHLVAEEHPQSDTRALCGATPYPFKWGRLTIDFDGAAEARARAAEPVLCIGCREELPQGGARGRLLHALGLA